MVELTTPQLEGIQVKDGSISCKGLRIRSRKACTKCHSRKVRCDTSGDGTPCTNCSAFGFDCILHVPKKKRPRTKRLNRIVTALPAEASNHEAGHAVQTNHREPSEPEVDSQDLSPQSGSTFSNGLRDSIGFSVELASLWPLMQSNNSVHKDLYHPLMGYKSAGASISNGVSSVDMAILHQQGAFLLPPERLRNHLVDSFFTWTAPILPVVNRRQFMRQYSDPAKAPSLLLLQAILLAGASMSSDSELCDADGSKTATTIQYYRRAKALYDAGYERDRVAVIQALIIMGWYCETPRDVETMSRVSRAAITEAQTIGIHRSLESPLLSKTQRGLYKRIWWTLVSRDRLLAVALGRPMVIDLDDSDNPPICDEDFMTDDKENEGDGLSDYHPQRAAFYVHYTRLCLIMGFIYSRFYSAASKYRAHCATDIAQYDAALSEWFKQCPSSFAWKQHRQGYWGTILQLHYQTAICLLHRANMFPSTSSKVEGQADKANESILASRSRALDAARSISNVIEELRAHGDLEHVSPFLVYSLFSALVVDFHHIRLSRTPSCSLFGSARQTCLLALREVSKVWLTGETIYVLFKYLFTMEIQKYTSRLTKSDVEQNLEMTDSVASTDSDTQSNGKGGGDLNMSESQKIFNNIPGLDMAREAFLPQFTYALEMLPAHIDSELASYIATMTPQQAADGFGVFNGDFVHGQGIPSLRGHGESMSTLITSPIDTHNTMTTPSERRPSVYEHDTTGHNSAVMDSSPWQDTPHHSLGGDVPPESLIDSYDPPAVDWHMHEGYGSGNWALEDSMHGIYTS